MPIILRNKKAKYNYLLDKNYIIIYLYELQIYTIGAS